MLLNLIHCHLQGGEIVVNQDGLTSIPGLVEPMPSPERRPCQFQRWIRSRVQQLTSLHHRRLDRRIEEIELQVLSKRAPNVESIGKDEGRGAEIRFSEERMSEMEGRLSDMEKRITKIEKN